MKIALPSFAIGLSAGILAFLVLPVKAQTIKNGGLSGKIVSARVDGVFNSSVPFFTTPVTGFFILTQFCHVSGSGLRGNTFGRVAYGSGDACITYNPGIAFPQNETLECISGGGCLITGIFSNK